MRLIYHIYVPENGINLIHKIHFACLKEYSHRFNSALFIISINNIEDYNTINTIKNELKSYNFKHIEFKITKNDSDKREGKTFKKEIADKILTNPCKELTFFGHTHGTSRNDENTLSQAYWITSMYYFLLDDAYFSNHQNIEFCLGAFPFYSDLLTSLDRYPKYHWWYHGSFFILNELNLKKYIEENSININEFEYCREYAEHFLGNIFDISKSNSMMRTRYEHIHLENDFVRLLKILTPEEDANKYLNWFHNLKTKHNFNFSLNDYAIEYKSEKGSIFYCDGFFYERTGYADFYEKYVSKYKGKSPNIIEIGIENNESINMWNEYFNHECFLVGIDKEIKYSIMKNYQTININLLDKNHWKWFDEYFNNKTFDIIVDSGHYSFEEQIESILGLYKKLSKNGIYIIENIQKNNVLNYLFYNQIENNNSYNEIANLVKDIIICSNNTPYYNDGHSVSCIITFKN